MANPIACCGVVMLATVVFLSTTGAALRFPLHADRTPTCFQIELGAEDVEHGKLVQVSYETNRSSAAATQAEGAPLPSNLEVSLFAPVSSDHGTDSKSPGMAFRKFVVPHTRRDTTTFRVAGVPLNPMLKKALSLGSRVGAEQLISGAYSVCFARLSERTSRLFSLLAGAASPESAVVTLHVVGNERYTLMPSDALDAQMKGVFVADDDSSEVDEETLARRHRSGHSNYPHLQHRHVDSPAITSLEDQARRLGAVVSDLTVGAVDLRTRHEAVQATSNSTFTRVWVMALVTILVMLLMCVRQLTITKKTLRQRGLI